MEIKDTYEYDLKDKYDLDLLLDSIKVTSDEAIIKWFQMSHNFVRSLIWLDSRTENSDFVLTSDLIKELNFSRPQAYKFLENFAVISLLDKTRDTSFQRDSNKEERIRIIKGSFIVKEADFIPEKVLLVDDLWESGTTMAECCRKL